ncbi:MAG: ROK family protein [Jatrophihabitantaceae bacterium]
MGSQDAVIAVDVGGTEIKAALCDPDGSALARLRRPTPVGDGGTGAVAAVCELIDELAGKPALQADRRVRGVGLILPGVVDAAAGIARYSVNIGWRELAIRELVSNRVGLPVAIEHDVRAAGLAEASLGAARDVDEALFLAIGTGIAGASIVNGRLISGSSNLAGEIGHLPVFPDGETCACGQQGCTETYASAAALSRRYQALNALNAPSAPSAPNTVSDRLADPPAARLGAEQVLARAEAGDPIASQVLDEALTALSRALICYIMLLDPALIVIGGGLSLAGDRLLQPLAAAIEAGLRWRPAPPLVTARFGAESGRVGAALVGWRAYGEQPGR